MPACGKGSIFLLSAPPEPAEPAALASLSGDVEVRWKEAPGAARLKPEKGDILMCQSWPRSDIAVRVPSDLTTTDTFRPESRRGIIRNIRRLTNDVAQFDLQLSGPMRFQPGQFVVLESPDVAGGRAYSMVNFGPELDRLVLVLKRKPSGCFTDWFFDKIAGDREVDVFGPLGRAVFRPEERRNIICIAGGSGIAGIMSILECAIQTNHFSAHKGVVVFGCQDACRYVLSGTISRVTQRLRRAISKSPSPCRMKL